MRNLGCVFAEDALITSAVPDFFTIYEFTDVSLL